MKLSVVILNYNVRYFLELCLQSVVAATEHLDAEIIVVDNNSTDDSCEMIESQFPDVKLIENKENLGFSKGNNIGVNKAIGEYVCILNPDTVVAENTFSELLLFAESKSNLGILGCQLVNGSGNFLPESKRNIPTPKVAFQKIVGNENLYYSHLDKDSTGKIEILVGAFMILKTELYKALDGFDEDYFMYGEDIDLSYRILKKGYDNYYNGKVTIIHFKGESTVKDKRYIKRFYGAMKLFYKKHFKNNFFKYLLVYLGIEFVSVLNKAKLLEKPLRKGSYVVSSRNIENLKSLLPKPIINYNDLSHFNGEDLILLDSEIMSFKHIIKFMKSNYGKKKQSYRIWPKNCNFIIGSDNNEIQGEVIKF